MQVSQISDDFENFYFKIIAESENFIFRFKSAPPYIFDKVKGIVEQNLVFSSFDAQYYTSQWTH